MQSSSASDEADISKVVRQANHRSSLWSKISRGANILRYYRVSQLARRACSLATPKIRSRKICPFPAENSLSLRADALEKFSTLATARSVRTTANADELLANCSAGKFTLLDQTVELGTPVDWRGQRTSHPSRLWTFQLHYQDYLLDLATCDLTDGADPWPTIWAIVTDWIEQNPPAEATIDDDAWHPYCISRRLPVWAQLLAMSSPPAELHERIVRSVATQADTLCDSLEFDLGGNHLLENLHALIVAAVLLDGKPAQQWLKVARQHLPAELSRQVLPHGEHYERAPMYHCQVLGNLLQSTILLATIDDSLASTCRDYATQMFEFVVSILHPDGEIPLFGDSCFGEAYSVSELTQLATLADVDQAATRDAGAHTVGAYWVWRSGDDALILDSGPAGADDLPAHAHCDLLNFEASIGGQRWIVDSGLFDYDDSDMRAYCRSSAAHNVVALGLLNQCDIWSRFRMGRRGRSSPLESGQDGEFSWCQATHDGYRYYGIPKLSRLMVAHSSGVWTCLDAASGRSNQPLVGRLHLGPEVQILEHAQDRILLAVGDLRRWLLPTSEVMLEVSDGWHCDRFGVRKRIPVINYCQANAGDLGRPFGWSLTPTTEMQVSVSTFVDAPCQLRVATGGFSHVFSKQIHN